MATNKICDYKNKKNLIIAKWLDRMVPILAFNSKNYNNFKN